MKVITLDFDFEKFVRSLQKPTISKYIRLVDLLEKFGDQLRMPYSKPVRKGLFELRIRGTQEVRIFYTFHKRQAVLLHGFVKKAQKTPLNEIEVATSKLIELTKT